MVARELEVLGAGALGALIKRRARHAPAAGTPCANCATPLQGPYCHACGQSSDDQHRSLWHLTREGIEGLTHLDGRLAQTIPALFFRPGKLARDHFEGRRQRHVPPFRLFLVTLLVFMFVLEALVHGGAKQVDAHGQTVSVKTAHGKPVAVTLDGKPAALADQQKVDAAFDIDTGDKARDAKRASALKGWLKPRLERAIADKDYYLMVVFTWAHRLAFLLLPILASLLALVYVSRRKRFFVYDHLIVAMQFLSFLFLIAALAWALPDPLRGWAILIAMLWTPINLFQTLRGAYGSSVAGAVAKTGFLWISTVVIFNLLLASLLVLALAQM